MATEKQTAANRQNSQKSTGPRTAEGKARSAQNALTTGIDAQSEIIRGESREKLEALVVQFNQEYCPVTQAERFQVDILVRCTWMIMRLSKAEAQLWEAGMKAAFQATEKDEVRSGAVLRPTWGSGTGATQKCVGSKRARRGQNEPETGSNLMRFAVLTPKPPFFLIHVHGC